MSRRARKVIADDDTSILVSAASAWEISTKGWAGSRGLALVSNERVFDSYGVRRVW